MRKLYNFKAKFKASSYSVWRLAASAYIKQYIGTIGDRRRLSPGARSDMKVGFIGNGTITEAIVTGIAQSKLDVAAPVVSPRNSAVASKLAATFPLVQIARDNQAVIDHSDIVFLAIRPQILRDVLRELRFRDGQRIIGLVAATDREQPLRWTGGRTRISQAIPLPFVADKTSPTVSTRRIRRR